ncbi:MAG: glycosyltransferase family 39 protein [Acidobacteria bacterium]|nr:glycosyltransferase family 39 protein [Acidobacteriota bacterium]
MIINFPERLQGWQKLLPYALLLSVTLALYGPTLYFHFVWDDNYYITTNYRIHGLSWQHLRAVWTNTYLGHYAPIQHTFLAVLYYFSGLEPFGYHLGQLLVHAASVCLLYSIQKEIETPRVALLASLLFVVHPTSVETVAWISETKSTLAFLFFLLSWRAFLRLRERGGWSNGAFSAAFLVCSLLAKINTVVAPAIFFLWDYKERALDRKRLWSLAWFFLVSAVFTGIHLSAFHGSQQILESTYYGGLGVHLMNLPLLVLFYLQMTILPHPLSAWQMFPVQQEFNGLIGLGWVGLLAMAWLLLRSPRSVQFWGLWFLVFLLPVLQIIPFPIWVADRYLYIPAIGLFVLASRGFFWVGGRLRLAWQQWGWQAAMSAIVIALAWRTDHHVPVWTNDLTLWAATTQTCMTSPYCHLNLGLALLQNRQTERGIKELIRAVEIRPTPRYLMYLGDAFTMSAKDYRQALIAYQMALVQGGSDITAEFHAKMARCYLMAGRFEEAGRAIEAGKKLNANDPALLVIEAFLQWRLGNLEQTRHALVRVFRITGRRSNPADFLYPFWGNAKDVGRLLADLRRQ